MLLILFESDNPQKSNDGEIQVSIPRDAMPSFKSNNNRIYWSILIIANVPRWPDMLDEYRFEVKPLNKSDFHS